MVSKDDKGILLKDASCEEDDEEPKEHEEEKSSIEVEEVRGLKYCETAINGMRMLPGGNLQKTNNDSMTTT